MPFQGLHLHVILLFYLGACLGFPTSLGVEKEENMKDLVASPLQQANDLLRHHNLLESTKRNETNLVSSSIVANKSSAFKTVETGVKEDYKGMAEGRSNMSIVAIRTRKRGEQGGVEARFGQFSAQVSTKKEQYAEAFAKNSSDVGSYQKDVSIPSLSEGKTVSASWANNSNIKDNRSVIIATEAAAMDVNNLKSGSTAHLLERQHMSSKNVAATVRDFGPVLGAAPVGAPAWNSAFNREARMSVSSINFLSNPSFDEFNPVEANLTGKNEAEKQEKVLKYWKRGGINPYTVSSVFKISGEFSLKLTNRKPSAESGAGAVQFVSFTVDAQREKLEAAGIEVDQIRACAVAVENLSKSVKSLLGSDNSSPRPGFGWDNSSYIFAHPVDVVIAGSAKARKAGSSPCICVDFKFVNWGLRSGLFSLDHCLCFPEGNSEWERREMRIKLSSPPAEATVYVVMYGKKGDAFVDDVSLTVHPVAKKEGESREGTLLSRYLAMEKNGSLDRQECTFQDYAVYPFYKRSSIKPNEAEITLATQLTVDRIRRIYEIATIWDGPIDAVLYIPLPSFHQKRKSEEEANAEEKVKALDTVDRFVAKLGDIVKRLNIHLVRKCHTVFPTNVLRNVALRYIQTEYFIMDDIDLLPAPGMQKRFLDLVSRMPDNDIQRTAFVVPCFEMDPKALAGGFPKDKRALLYLHNKVGTVKTGKGTFWPAHGPTNFDRWKTTKEPYTVAYKRYFEPYYILKRGAPGYDERFSGYGHNKAEHALHLHHFNYKFLVMPNDFLIHINHRISDTQRKVNQTRFDTPNILFLLLLVM
uniref:Glycosyltransferase family 49 protein n=1 Tax=Palpitomonas bilix TaxID=652834 RepID=A0A7S3DJR4_9EUKA|mmetsp:Transcript_40681/g.105602  ORF Transcript_40681/g.105602 Transcript_40681/m.105602 type:complete len:811 (+) Transcript_40681:45-2477(+)